MTIPTGCRVCGRCRFGRARPTEASHWRIPRRRWRATQPAVPRAASRFFGGGPESRWQRPQSPRSAVARMAAKARVRGPSLQSGHAFECLPVLPVPDGDRREPHQCSVASRPFIGGPRNWISVPPVSAERARTVVPCARPLRGNDEAREGFRRLGVSLCIQRSSLYRSTGSARR
jgi:hypothetical protein